MADGDATTEGLLARNIHNNNNEANEQSQPSPALSEVRPLPFDVSQVIDHLGYGKFQRFMFVLCGVGWAADIGEVLVASFFVQPVSRQFDVTSEATKSLIASAPFVGMLIGAVVFGTMADRVGRRPAFALTCIVTGVAGLLCAAAQSFEMFVFLRGLVGFGLGGNLPIDFSLFLEFVPAADRRSATIWLTGWSIVGTLLTAGCAWLTDVEHSESGWRLLSVLIATPSLLMAFLRPWVPESPHFLQCVGRHQECVDALDVVAKFNDVSLSWTEPIDPLLQHTRVSTGNNNDDDNRIQLNDSQHDAHLLPRSSETNINQHRTTTTVPQPIFTHPGSHISAEQPTAHKQNTNVTWRNLFQRNVRIRSVTMIIVWFTMSFGFYGFMVRVPVHLTQRHLTIDSSGLVFLASLAQIPGLLTAVACVSRIGATATISLSAGLTSMSMAAFAVVETHATATVVAYVLYNVGVSAMFAVLYLWTSVSLPTELRGTGFGVCSAMNRVAGIVAPVVGGLLEQIWGEKAAGLLNAACLLIASAAALSLSPYLWCTEDIDASVGGNDDTGVDVHTVSRSRTLDTCDQRLG